MPTDPDALPVPPACGPTHDRLQAVLDGTLPPAALDADPHPAACPTCRARVRAARLVLTTLAVPQEAVALPAGLAFSILAAVRADRRARQRRRVFAMVGGLAAAAAILVAVWIGWPKSDEMVKQEPTPTPVPPQAPIHLQHELAKAGDALRESSHALTEPAAAAPRVFAALTDSLLRTPANPMDAQLEPARKSLAELPEAAKAGLEPVTGTAQKAFARLLHDVGGMQPKTKS